MAKKLTPAEVMRRMNAGEPMQLVDSRSANAWGSSDEKLPGAIRVPPDDIEAHAATLPKGRPIVTYCT
jgi:rhodanese-related sulfurtransferase